MRIKINFTKNTELVPINEQHTLSASYFHKCLGNNDLHDKPSDYCLSPLMGGKFDNGFLNFENGGYIIVSSNDMEIITKIMIGSTNNKELGYGMQFNGIKDRSASYHNGWNNFASLSPILLSKSIDNHKRFFYTLKNKEEYISNLEERTKRKLLKIDSNLDLRNFKIEIPEYNSSSHKIKKIMVHNVTNFANQHHLNIFCNSEVAELLSNVGIGQSTGCGFGTIYLLKDDSFYVNKD